MFDGVSFPTVDFPFSLMQDKDLGRVPNEVYFLKKMSDHANVIKFLHYQQISAEKFVIITERPRQCKDLFDIRHDEGGYLTEQEAKGYVKALLDVAIKMEKRNIAHRDIKLENILYDFDANEIKLIDFGLASGYKPGELEKDFAGKHNAISHRWDYNCYTSLKIIFKYFKSSAYSLCSIFHKRQDISILITRTVDRIECNMFSCRQ